MSGGGSWQGDGDGSPKGPPSPSPCHLPAASIDIGTNSVLLLVAKVWDDQIEVVFDEASISRLGEGLHEQPNFLPQAEERTLAILRDYKKKCDAAGVKKILAVGTAGCRKARNAASFIERVKRETGITIKIISGDEEARLSYLSVCRDFGLRGVLPGWKRRNPKGSPGVSPPSPLASLYALDIGGGSTEVIGKDGGLSLDIGTVLLTEKYFCHDPPTADEISRVEKIIKAKSVLPSTKDPVTLVGLAGSVTTLSAVHQKLPRWDPAKIQGSILKTRDLEKLILLFRQTTLSQKKTMPGMVTGREDTILAGSLILKKVMERLGTDEVVVSDRGLRFGLLWDRTRQPV